MLRLLSCGIIVLMVPVHGVQAQKALPPETRNDIRCFVSAISALGGPSTANQSVALTAFYYLGRIDGRDPELDLETAIAREAKQMTQADMREESKRCGNTLTARGAVISAIGARLSDQ